MSDTSHLRLRKGNRAFDYLIANYQLEGTKAGKLVEAFPEFANALQREAQNAAKQLFDSGARNPISRAHRALTVAFSGWQTLLENCILDLMLVVCFQELHIFFADKELASIFADALLYQTTGKEPTSPDEAEFRYEDTSQHRGLPKYILARRQFSHLGDTGAWLFGKEVAAIRGHQNDIADIVSVSSYSFLLRVHAKWIIRHFLYDTWPTETEKEALQKTLEKQEKEMLEIFKNPLSKPTQ